MTDQPPPPEPRFATATETGANAGPCAWVHPVPSGQMPSWFVHPGCWLALLLASCLSPASALAAEPAILPAATLVTVKVQKGSAFEALSQIQRQVQKDVAMSFQGVPSIPYPPVTITLSDCPFWEAIMEVCRQSDLSFYCSTSDDTRPGMHFQRRAEGFGYRGQPISRAGGCLVIATRVERTRAESFGQQQPASDTIRIGLNLLVDPAMRVTAVHEARITRAEDENGQTTLSPPQSPSPNLGKLPLLLEKGTTVYLPCTARFGRKFALLLGNVPIRVRLSTNLVSVDEPLTNLPVTMDFREYELRIDKLKPAYQSGYQLGVRFRIKQQPKHEDFFRAQSRDYQDLLRDISLTDEAGHRFVVEYGGGGVGANEHSYAPVFTPQPGEKMGLPARLTWELPSAEEWIEVPIEFRDLPIP